MPAGIVRISESVMNGRNPSVYIVAIATVYLVNIGSTAAVVNPLSLTVAALAISGMPLGAVGLKAVHAV